MMPSCLLQLQAIFVPTFFPSGTKPLLAKQDKIYILLNYLYLNELIRNESKTCLVAHPLCILLCSHFGMVKITAQQIIATALQVQSKTLQKLG
jgi:hypothetical protein